MECSNKKQKAIIFGLGDYFARNQAEIEQKYNIVALTDNDVNVRKVISQKRNNVIKSIDIMSHDFDCVVITALNATNAYQISQQVRNFGASKSSIRIILLESLTERFSLEGKKVLEIGCGSGDLVRLIADYCDVESIVGIDPGLTSWYGGSESKGENWSVQDGDSMNLEFTDNSFDIVVSYVTFEHIVDIGKALSEIRRILKPHGSFYTEIGGIWTSAAGHHWSRPTKNGYYWNEDYMKLIPPWGHLYMSESEMQNHLASQGCSNDLADDIINFIYKSDIINRYSRKNLISSFMNCGMIVRGYGEHVTFNRFAYCKPRQSKSELSADIVTKVKAAGYDAEDLGVHHMTVHLEKYAEFLS